MVVTGRNPDWPSRLWLIGGTTESAELARQLAAAEILCTISVTTENARSLYPSTPQLRIWVGRLTPAQLPEFLQQEAIAAILDASHPFAVEISQLAIAASTQYSLSYLRFERPSLASGPPAFQTLDSLLKSSYLEGQRVLLTLGYRWLEKFRPWQDRATLFARILPSQEALAAALAAGFTPDRLIALRPPIAEALEQALWQQWKITCVVTKASGIAGGEATKRKLAQALGVALVILDRPQMTYPCQTHSLKTALKFALQVQQTLSPGF